MSLILEDGRLYRNRSGQRFRVTRTGDGFFTCKSAPGYWSEDGTSFCYWNKDGNSFFDNKWDLIEEIPKFIWVSLCALNDIKDYVSNYTEYRISQYRHVQVKVRKEPRKKKVEVAVAAPRPKNELVTVTSRDGHSFSYRFDDEGGVAYLDIETSSICKFRVRL